MRIIVFGNGFIGRQVATHANLSGDEVTIVTRSKRSTDSSLQLSGINFSYVDKPSDFLIEENNGQNRQENHVYAFGVASPYAFESISKGSISIELIKELTLLAEASNEIGARVSYISSAGTVYGETTYHVDENYMCSPISAYGKFHLEMEKTLRNIIGARLTSFRVANPYGADQSHQNNQGFISYVVDRLKNRVPVELFGFGEQLRDYIKIDEVGRIIHEVNSLEVIHETINVATGVSTTNKQVAELIASVLQLPLDLRFVENRNFDVVSNLLSVNLLRQLGVTPPTPISAETLNYLVG